MKSTDVACDIVSDSSSSGRASNRCSKELNLAVNAPFFQEIKADGILLKELLRGLDALLSGTFSHSNRARRLSDSLAALRDQLAMHFALEDIVGYFTDALEVAPELSSLAHTLRCEHKTLYTEICEIAEQAERFANPSTSTRRIRRVDARARAFVDQLHRHECRETEMILRALYDDLGVGDRYRERGDSSRR